MEPGINEVAVIGSSIHSLARERFHRAELLLELDRPREALDWFETFFDTAPAPEFVPAALFGIATVQD